MMKNHANDFWIKKPPRLSTDPAVRREWYQKNYGSVHWCEWDNARPSGEEVNYGPSVDSILDYSRRVRVHTGDDFDPEFTTHRCRVGKPLDFDK